MSCCDDADLTSWLGLDIRKDPVLVYLVLSQQIVLSLEVVLTSP